MKERKPITVIRRPILSFRKSIICKRSPIVCKFHRKPIYSTQIKYERCRLCAAKDDCGGNFYGGSTGVVLNYRVLHVKNQECDWEELERAIWEIEKQGCFLRLLIDREIPDSILYAAAYNSHNILQVNLNLMLDMMCSPKTEWVRRIIAKSCRCGLYCVMFMFPIIPAVTKTHQLIRWISSLRGYGFVHYNLKFGTLQGGDEVNGYLNFNGYAVPIKYLVKTSRNLWTCSEEYKEEFLQIIHMYVDYRNISLAVCGETTDCTGLIEKKGGIQNVTKN